jgi:exosortase B
MTVSRVPSPKPGSSSESRSSWIPAGADLSTVLVLTAAWLVLYLPTYWGLANGIWKAEEHSYGPVILAASLWLFWHDRDVLAALPVRPAPRAGYALVGLALVAYAVGRSQDILIFEVGSQLPLLMGLLLLFLGKSALRASWVPIALLIFVVPLPGDIVAAVTAPLKSAVSAVAAELLYWVGYPIARTGVMLSVGQYQLLVADACAGLTSMFTLEAMGLIYMKLMGYRSALRNTLLGLLLIPIAFLANVIRVIVLVLVTYHLGDAAGQGFVHSAAGIVLFAVATVLMLVTDYLIGLVPSVRRQHTPNLGAARPRAT